ncbi:MAG: proton-conducting transporter membrane subunit, partial [Gammaproteobacteria bacterium]|nr:proton-conducting transporter membrane subunit [Gammaproteobacteria bacterium]
MVNVIFIIVIGLGAAFLLGLLRENWRNTAYALTLGSLAAMAWIAARWLLFFAVDGGTAFEVFTAGTEPPFAINLRVGITESVLLLLVIFSGLLSAIYMSKSLYRLGGRAMSVLLVFIMALCGIILTRDIFNLFVFFELAVIATAGLLLISENKQALSAGFKYLIISQMVSVFLLIGIIFTYHVSGSLNIDSIAGLPLESLDMMKGIGALAFFFMLIAILTEAKPFPANGWALDIYESAHPAFSAIFSAAMAGSAAVYAVDKLLLIGGQQWLPVVTAIGLLSFVAANLLALSQTHDRRTLGYSSVGQVGLILAIVGQRDILGDSYLFIAGGIILSHAVAKAGLYWMSGLISQRHLTDWTVLRGHPLLILAFVSFIAMLSGLPPFPSFYAKWDLVMILASENRLWILAFVLIGSLLEASYLFRWFGYIIKREKPESKNNSSENKSLDNESALLSQAPHKLLVIFSTLAVTWGLAYLWGELSVHDNLFYALPLLFALSFLLLDWLPAWIKNTLAIAGMVYYFVINYSQYDPLQIIFAA